MASDLFSGSLFKKDINLEWAEWDASSNRRNISHLHLCSCSKLFTLRCFVLKNGTEVLNWYQSSCQHDVLVFRSQKTVAIQFYSRLNGPGAVLEVKPLSGLELVAFLFVYCSTGSASSAAAVLKNY